MRSFVKDGGDIFRAAIQYDERSSWTMRLNFSLFNPFWSRLVRSLFDTTLGPKIQQMISGHVPVADFLANQGRQMQFDAKRREIIVLIAAV